MNDNDFRDVILNARARQFGYRERSNWTAQEEQELESNIMGFINDLDKILQSGRLPNETETETLNNTFNTNIY